MTTRSKTDPSRRAWPLFLIVVVVGLGTLIPFALQAWRDVRITWFYRPATCSIISSSTYTTTTRFRIRSSSEQSSAHPRFTYQLQVDGRWYTAVGFDNMDGITSHPGETLAFKPGQSVPCWYDPLNPENAVLRREVYKPFYAGLLIPALFLLIGGSMLVRSLRPVQAVSLDGLTPGEALAVRLQPELTGARAAGCFGAGVAVGTAGVVIFFGYLARSGRLFSGDGLTTIAFIAAGIDAFLAYHLVRTIRTLRLPEPAVEIDHEPLRPGESARLFVRQKGPARFESFAVSVVCEEQGEKGTHNRHHHQLMKRANLDIAMAGDLAESLTIEIPAGAPASLRELQTIVTWKITVARKTPAGPADRDFVFRVVSDESHDG